MPSTFSSPHHEKFGIYEQRPRAKQKTFLEGYQFKEVSINDPKDIQAGDHLICRRGLYDHHMLCTDNCTDQLKIIEYSGPASSFSAPLSSVISKDLTVFGKIKERSYPVKEFLTKNVSRDI